MPLSTGTRLGPYEVLASLGAGGMGEVYLAADARLGRRVVLKILPEAFTLDADRKRRFAQEARAASALNHPNIITIYDIGEAEGTGYIAMEFVKGKMLAALVPLSLPDALEYAIQIADALAAAHAAGIVHRDIKPANIIISDSRAAKVLDFGLAKPAAESVSSSSSLTRTSPAHTEIGTVVGTASYMSPEQARGHAVDSRSDIFSFGATLYEMLSGARAFDAGDAMSTISKVLTQESPQLVSVPDDLNTIIRRCLRKDPARRFQHMDDVKVALMDVRDEREKPTATPAAPRPRAYWRAAVSVILVALAAAGGWLIGRSSEEPRLPDLTFTRLTSDIGLTTLPAISPDGRLVVYASDRAGNDNVDLWLHHVGGGNPIQLTRDQANESEPSFSPDGSQIVFRSEREGGGLYVMPALGGEPRLVVAGNAHRPRFSPDGSRLAYSTGSNIVLNHRAFVAPLTGGAPTQIQSALAFASAPVWSPDGRHLLLLAGTRPRFEDVSVWVVGADAVAEQSAAFRVNVPGSSIDIVPDQWLTSGILFSRRLGGTTSLWHAAFSTNDRTMASLRRLTAGAGGEHWASVSADGRLVVASELFAHSMWTLPLDTNQVRTTGEAQRLTAGTADEMYPSISADGRYLAFQANDDPIGDIWLLDLSTGVRKPLALTPRNERRPVISPDGSRVAYTADDRDERVVQVIPTRGGIAETVGTAILLWNWSSHGDKLLTMGGELPRLRVELVDLVTRQATTLLQHAETSVFQTHYSPDGRWLTILLRGRIFVAPVSEEAPPPESTWIEVVRNGDLPRWSPDGNVIYYISDVDSFRCIYAQRLDPATRRPKGEPIAVFHSHSARRSLRHQIRDSGEIGLAVAPGRLVFSQMERSSNIWMAQLDLQSQ